MSMKLPIKATRAYSEAAALIFSPRETLPSSLRRRFPGCHNGHHGIVPMENSIGGTIHRNYDLLVDHEIPITGEVELDVVHCLQALPGAKIEDIKIVYSHQQALAQCERYLRELGVTVEAVYDTAGGAKLVAEQRLTGAAALASRRAAEVFGLDVNPGSRAGLRVQHHPLLRHWRSQPTDADKTPSSMAPSTPDRCSRRSACSRCGTSI